MPVADFAQGVKTPTFAMVHHTSDGLRAKRPTVTVTDAGGKTADAGKPAASDSGESFWKDVLDVVNPLQHLPVVGTVYRAVTGDKIGDVEKVAGDTLYGGPIGLVSSLANIAFEKITGKDPGEMVMGWLGIGHDDTALASSTTPAKTAAPVVPQKLAAAKTANALPPATQKPVALTAMSRSLFPPEPPKQKKLAQPIAPSTPVAAALTTTHQHFAGFDAYRYQRQYRCTALRARPQWRDRRYADTGAGCLSLHHEPQQQHACHSTGELAAFAEDRAADAHMRRAEFDRRLEIPAHAHAEQRQTVLARQLLQQREMRRGRLIRRRDAHQSLHRQPQFVAAQRNEAGGVFRRDAGLLRFLARVYLDEQRRAPAGLFDLGLQRLGELGPVERMDGIETFDRLARLVGLQRPRSGATRCPDSARADSAICPSLPAHGSRRRCAVPLPAPAGSHPPHASC